MGAGLSNEHIYARGKNTLCQDWVDSATQTVKMGFYFEKICDTDEDCTSCQECSNGLCKANYNLAICGNDDCETSTDPCCGSSDPCCGSSDPCCGLTGVDLECCQNPNSEDCKDPCIDSADPCCGSDDACCGLEGPALNCCRDPEACETSDPCLGTDCCPVITDHRVGGGGYVPGYGCRYIVFVSPCNRAQLAEICSSLGLSVIGFGDYQRGLCGYGPQTGGAYNDWCSQSSSGDSASPYCTEITKRSGAVYRVCCNDGAPTQTAGGFYVCNSPCSGGCTETLISE